MADLSPREQRGQTVRETWVAWAKRQRAPKRSWLIGWDDLDDGQREVDMLIGDAVAAAERERIRLTAEEHDAAYWTTCFTRGCPYNPRQHARHLHPFADLIGEADGNGL